MFPSSDPPTGAVARFGTLQGVLRPITLTVLGAMLYLREGWLVGNSGLLGAWLVIGAAYVITGTTALSVSSIATNTRMRAGGAFAIIAGALGLEAGGAIGLPLYLAQSASAAMYLFAFAEGFAVMFPGVPQVLVVLGAFAVVSVVARRSAQLAFSAQTVMAVIVVMALLSAVAGLVGQPLHSPTWFGTEPEADLRGAFSIFFPAATGIMVGVGMSGSLVDPRRSLPRGTLGAWAITLVVYVLGAAWYSMVADPSTLVAHKTVMVDRALFGSLVLLGLLSASSMAALSSLVAAPRLLAAMAAQRVTPMGGWLAGTDASGEPRNATLATLGLVGLFLLSGSLDAIAPLVTTFFILTYLGIHVVVALEQQLALISFRPTFAIHPSVPIVGVVVCILGLLLSSPATGIAGIALVIGIYGWLHRRQLETPWETVRSGLGEALADWAARRVADEERSERAWKPDLLVPVADLQEARELLPLLGALTAQAGSVKLMGTHGGNQLYRGLEQLGHRLRAGGAYTTWTVVDAGPSPASPGADGGAFAHGAGVAMDAMRGAFFPPNLVLMDASRHDSAAMQAVMEHAHARQMGTILHMPHPHGGLGQGREVAVWLSDRSPDWPLRLHNANLDLPVLTGMLLAKARGGRVRLITVVPEDMAAEPARAFMERLCGEGRLPRDTITEVIRSDFLTAVEHCPYADIHLFGLGPEVDAGRLEELRDAAGGAALFLRDSGQESVLA
jgi:amino acid transporter